MGYFKKDVTPQEPKADAPKVEVEEKKITEDEYLEGVYNAICKHCDDNGLARPSKGIVDKTKMHVCQFNPDGGFVNKGFYEFLGTKACMPTKEGESWETNVKKAFNFPIMVNANSGNGSFGAVIIPHLVDVDKYILLKEWRLPIGAYAYNFPRGFPNKSEKVLATALREFTEETGLTFSMETAMKKAVILGEVQENNGISYNLVTVVYLPIAGVPKIKTEEGATAILVDKADFYAGVDIGNGTKRNDGIIDNFTLAAMMKLLCRGKSDEQCDDE